VLCGGLGPALPAAHLILLGLGLGFRSGMLALKLIQIFILQEPTAQFLSFGKIREIGGGCFRGVSFGFVTFAGGL